MSTGLLNQLRAHYEQIDDLQEPVRPRDVSLLLNKVRELPLVPPPRPARFLARRLWAATAAGVLILLLIGGVAWLLRSGTDDGPADEPTETTIPIQDPERILPDAPVGALGVIGPGAWSVAATFADSAVAPDILAATADAVRSWPGVLDVVEVPNTSAWQQLTGLTSDCGGGDVSPPCGSGILVLTVDSSMGQTGIRLESEFAMIALTPLDVPVSFFNGYLDAAIESASPVPLEFDPSILGTEQPLMGPFRDYEPDNSVCGGPCDVGVEIELDGVVAGTGILVTERDSVTTIEFAMTALPIDELLVDRLGGGRVLAELRSVVERRRVYLLAGLPLEAAVLTFQQADGSSVWQRPLAGMALILDSPGSGGPKEFSDEEPEIGGSLREESDDAGPFVVLDAFGTEIMRIQDTPDGPLIEDLRVAKFLSAELDPPRVGEPVATADLTVAATIDGAIGREVAGADGAIWVVSSTNAGGSIVRIDASGEVTESVAVDGFVLDVVASGDAVWISSMLSSGGLPWSDAGDTVGTVSRIDAGTGRVTHAFEAPAGGRLWIADGDLWVSHWAGFDRVDLETFTADRHPYPDDNQVWWGREWLGEANGSLWLLDGNAQQSVTRIDLATLRTEHLVVGFDPSPEMNAVLSEDAIWFIDCCDGEVARFDLESRGLTYLPNSGGGLGNAVHTGGAVWVPNRDRGTVTRIDRSTHEVTDVITVEPSPGGLVVAEDGAIWMTHEAGTVSRIDVATRQVSHQIDLGGAEDYWQLLPFDGAIWVAGSDGTIIRIVIDP